MSQTDSHESHSSGPSFDCTLGPADAEALDALVQAGYRVEAVEPRVRARAERVGQVLGLLRCNLNAREGFAADVQRAAAAGSRSPAGDESGLTVGDAEAIDALIMSGFDVGGVPAELRDRASKHAALANLVTSGPSLGSADFAARTFDLVMVAADAPTNHSFADAARARVRWTDLVALAATLLLGASVILPMLGSISQRQTRSQCLANLGSVASAVAQYGNDFKRALPMATAGLGGGVWNDVGGSPERSNSANLFTLARKGYSKLRDLACPGNAGACRDECPPGAMDWRNIDEVSYSYRLVFGPQRPNLDSPNRFVVLADRSPVVLASLRGKAASPLELSPNHRSGQEVLFSDGSVQWMTTSTLANGDNIWLPWQVEEIIRAMQAGQPLPEKLLKGEELPQSVEDTFLAP